MRAEYHKLVRGTIPAIIRGQGHVCGGETITEDEDQSALCERSLSKRRALQLGATGISCR
jgi:predicted house-cleaning noncanonical NTP pyrophosphatase (MazG superfamily)